jgi:hypothetical protein
VAALFDESQAGDFAKELRQPIDGREYSSFNHCAVVQRVSRPAGLVDGIVIRQRAPVVPRADKVQVSVATHD